MKKNGHIKIRGARTNNLNNVNVDIPLNQITCIHGPSGSGKSSLAHYTLYAESKRKFINSLPSNFKFFSDKPAKPEVDSIFPVLPVWNLPQNNPVLGSRQNVADLLEITPNIAKVFSRHGVVHCPLHSVPLEQESLSDKVRPLCSRNVKAIHVFISKEDYLQMAEGPPPSRSLMSPEEKINNFESEDSFWELFRVRPTRLGEIQKKLKENIGQRNFKLLLKPDAGKEFLWTSNENTFVCPKCDYHTTSLQRSFLQLNVLSPLGACRTCRGYGTQYKYDRSRLVKDPGLSLREGAVSLVYSAHFDYYYPIMLKELEKLGYDLDIPFKKLPQKIWDVLFAGIGRYPGFNSFFDYLDRKSYKKTVRIYQKRIQKEIFCPECVGTRVRDCNRNVKVVCHQKDRITYQEMLLGRIEETFKQLNEIKQCFKGEEVKQTYEALKIATELGLNYLNLTRKVKTLSAGEYQRLLLVRYFIFQGQGSLFIFDEPSLGLGRAEQAKIFRYIKKLRNNKNTIVIVDHSEYFINNSDYAVRMGPGAGKYGGNIVQIKANPKKLKTSKSEFNVKKRLMITSLLKAKSVRFYNQEIKNIVIPLRKFILVKGPPGVGKTCVFTRGIARSLQVQKGIEFYSDSEVVVKGISGAGSVNNIIIVDGTSLRTNSRSSVGTYLEILPEVRKQFASSEEGKALNLEPGHFSPNSEKGKCRTCEGKGFLEAEMKYLENVRYRCDDCDGKKIKPLYANIALEKLAFHELVNQPLNKIWQELKFSKKISKIKFVLEQFNLDYLNLDRSLTSLSGGERQRLKLAKTFIRPVSKSLIICENISFGLSTEELDKICNFLWHTVASENTIVVIDPHPLIEHFADNILELKRSKQGLDFKAHFEL